MKLLITASLSFTALTGMAQSVPPSLNNATVLGEGTLYKTTSGSKSYITYRDATQAVKWKNEIQEGKGLFKSDADDAILGSDHSEFAFATNSYRSPELKTDVHRFTKIAQDGTITYSKEFTQDALFSGIGRGDVIWLNFGFVTKDHLYLVYQKYGNKTNQTTFFIVGVNENLEAQSIELPGSAMAIMDFETRKRSKIRYLANDDHSLTYYALERTEKELRFAFHTFDLDAWKEEKTMMATLPVTKNDLFYTLATQTPVPGNTTAVVQKDDWFFMPNMIAGSQYIPDLACPFSFDVTDDTFYLFAQVEISNQPGVLLTSIDRTASDDQAIEPHYIFYKTIANAAEVVNLKHDKRFAPANGVFFNPENHHLLFTQGGYEQYYELGDNQFIPVKNTVNKLIPNAWFAVHQEYLKTNGTYNFPGLTDNHLGTYHNVKVHIGDKKVVVFYLPILEKGVQFTNELKVGELVVVSYDK